MSFSPVWLRTTTAGSSAFRGFSRVRPGRSSTEPTGAGFTSTATWSETPSQLTATVAFPEVTPVRRPSSPTWRIRSSDEVQATGRSTTLSPLMSVTVASNRADSPGRSSTSRGRTSTEATAGGRTVRLRAASWLSHDAVTTTSPGARARTRPTSSTSPRSGALDVQRTGRSSSSRPEDPRTRQVTEISSPTWTVVEGASRLTERTASGRTEMVVSVDWPSQRAITLTSPVAPAMRRPSGVISATEGSEEDQVTSRRARGRPSGPRGMAESWTVSPASTLRAPVASSRPATGAGVTVTGTDATASSQVALILAAPGASPVTRPSRSTRATSTSLLVQRMGRSASSSPWPLRGTARSWIVSRSITSPPRGESSRLTARSGETVTTPVPLTPSTLADTVAVPGFRARTRPWAVSSTTSGSSTDHSTGRSSRGRPAGSLGTQVTSFVLPTSRVRDGGETSTEATAAGVTVIRACPVRPSLEAMTTVFPFPWATTRPVPSTEATSGSLEVQLISRSVSSSPSRLSRRVRRACSPPSGKESSLGSTTTVSTRMGETARRSSPETPSASATMETGPGFRARTTPSSVTRATSGSLDVQERGRSGMGRPPRSRGVPVSLRLCPTKTSPEGGVREMEPTDFRPRLISTISVLRELPGRGADAARAPQMASMLGHRSSGRFSSIRVTMRASSGGQSGRRVRISVGSCSAWAAQRGTRSPLKGGSPQSIS